MTIIFTLTFICDMCDRIEAHSERTCDHDEIDVYVDKLVPGWTDVWADENHSDLICGGCFDRYSSLIKRDNFGSYRWTARPTPDSN